MNSYFYSANANQQGFTIVELLIVIVVIGILAAITLVAFGGVRDRANTSAAQNAANEVLKKTEIYRTLVGTYPANTDQYANEPETRLEGVAVQTAVAGVDGDPKNAVAIAICTTGFLVAYWDYTGTPGHTYLAGGGATAPAKAAAVPASCSVLTAA